MSKVAKSEFSPLGVVVTPTSMRQLSMIGKVNSPFKMFQCVFRKSLKTSVRSAFNDCLEKSGSRLVYINREYDGSERYFVLISTGFSYEFFPSDNDIIWLL